VRLFAALLAPVLACADPGGSDYPFLTLDHLEFLTERRVLPGGTFGLAPMALVWVYAEWDPSTHEYVRVHAHGAANQGPEEEGVACIDDVARAILVRARLLAAGMGGPDGRRRLAEYVRFVLGMEVEDGGLANFLMGDGSRNTHGKTSAPGVGWWEARALRGLAEAAPWLEGALGRRAAGLRKRLVARLGARVLPRLSQWHPAYVHRDGARQEARAPSWLPGDGTDVAAVYLLGLGALPEAGGRLPQGSRLHRLVAALADGILAVQQPDGLIPSWVGRPGQPASLRNWHGWGSYQPAALVTAWRVTGDERYRRGARRALDGWYARLARDGVPYSYDVGPEGEIWAGHPQIAYAYQTAVESASSVAEATGEARPMEMAATFATWFLGGNELGQAMAHSLTGRTFDDIGVDGLNRNSGAESTIEGLLALARVRGSRELRRRVARWAKARPRPARRPRRPGSR
jgi:hypothetical protein